jgi:hypothetical protein
VPGPLASEEVRAAQILTGATMAAWLACGVIPGVQPYAMKIRTVLLGAYLLGCAAFIAYLLIAVGTRVTARPPHRTVRAAFPHTAPTLGV